MQQNEQGKGPYIAGSYQWYYNGNSYMNEPPEDKAPLFSSWTAWYVFVLVVLAALIVLFTFFTNYFA